MDSPTTAENGSGKRWFFWRQFNWRMLLVRLLISGLSLLLVAALLPDIYFVDRSLLNLLFLAVALGLLNAFVKPVLQFLTLPFIFATYGLVIVLINTLVLILLSRLFPGLFAVNRLLWAFVGGALMGILSGALESLFGLSFPIAVEGERPPVEAVAPARRPPAVHELVEHRAAAGALGALSPEVATAGMEKEAGLLAADMAPAGTPGTRPDGPEDVHREENPSMADPSLASRLPGGEEQ